MTTRSVREWFTPGVIIQIVAIVVSVTLAWAGLRGDIQSTREKVDAQATAAKESQADTKKSIEALSAKIPDGAVIELRLGTLEKKLDSIDPLLLVGVKGDIESLKREQLRDETRDALLKDYVEGRISDVPYRPPGRRHRE